jgi:hypothetical protein
MLIRGSSKSSGHIGAEKLRGFEAVNVVNRLRDLLGQGQPIAEPLRVNTSWLATLATELVNDGRVPHVANTKWPSMGCRASASGSPIDPTKV